MTEKTRFAANTSVKTGIKFLPYLDMTVYSVHFNHSSSLVGIDDHKCKFFCNVQCNGLIKNKERTKECDCLLRLQTQREEVNFIWYTLVRNCVYLGTNRSVHLSGTTS